VASRSEASAHSKDPYKLPRCAVEKRQGRRPRRFANKSISLSFQRSFVQHRICKRMRCLRRMTAGGNRAIEILVSEVPYSSEDHS